METIARNTPQLTQETPASAAPAGATGVARRCVTVTLQALRAAGKAYMDAARYNPCWIGPYWFPMARPETDRESR